jgi:hypothetical protein
MAREFPRHVIRKLENENFPLVALGALTELRHYLDEVEDEAILKALELGAGAEDLADALGITRQGAYYKIKALEKRSADQPSGVVQMPELNGEPVD